MLSILIILAISMSILYLFDRCRNKAMQVKKFGAASTEEVTKAAKCTVDDSSSPKKPLDLDLVKKLQFVEKKASVSSINVTLNLRTEVQ